MALGAPGLIPNHSAVVVDGLEAGCGVGGGVCAPKKPTQQHSVCASERRAVAAGSRSLLGQRLLAHDKASCTSKIRAVSEQSRASI